MKEQIAIKEDDEIQEMFTKLKGLESRIDLIEILLKTTSKSKPESQSEKMKKVIQINTYRNGVNKRYFCETSREQQIFSENNPNVKTETFTLELLASTADEYLNAPENKKQFTEQEKANV